MADVIFPYQVEFEKLSLSLSLSLSLCVPPAPSLRKKKEKKRKRKKHTHTELRSQTMCIHRQNKLTIHWIHIGDLAAFPICKISINHFLCCLITWRRYHGINGLESGFDRVTRILMVLNVTWLVNKTHTQDKKETFEHTVKIIIYHISYIDIYHILYIIRRYISGSWSGCIVWLSQRRLLRRGTDVSKAGVQMGWGG